MVRNSDVVRALQTELLVFSGNNCKEINTRVRKRGGFHGKRVMSMSEAHLRLLQVSKDENSFFSNPIVSQLVHTFCTNTVMSLPDSIIKKLTLEIKKRMSVCKMAFLDIGVFVVYLKNWLWKR